MPEFSTTLPDASRRACLSFLQDRRNARSGPAKLTDAEGSWGYVQMHIPLLDYHVLIARNPELASTDKETYDRAWKQFARSQMARPYLTDDSIGKRKVNNRIIVK
jgi:hypothetical protein